MGPVSDGEDLVSRARSIFARLRDAEEEEPAPSAEAPSAAPEEADPALEPAAGSGDHATPPEAPVAAPAEAPAELDDVDEDMKIGEALPTPVLDAVAEAASEVEVTPEVNGHVEKGRPPRPLPRIIAVA